MRILRLALALALASLPAACATVPQRVEKPVNLKEDAVLRIPFSVSWTGTHDLELQFPTTASESMRILKDHTLEKIVGTATLTSEGKSLKRELPSSWERPMRPPPSIGTVIVRFHAEANKPYVLSLRIRHLPSQLPRQAIAVVREVTPHFHPGHRVYVLQ